MNIEKREKLSQIPYVLSTEIGVRITKSLWLGAKLFLDYFGVSAQTIYVKTVPHDISFREPQVFKHQYFYSHE